MTIAHVVPLRRFPADRPWFDYQVPDHVSVVPGHLVSIPFLGRTLRGIVWSVAEETPSYAVKPLVGLLDPEPRMTPYQQSVCQAVADQNFVSLGHVLDGIIPQPVKRKGAATAAITHRPSDGVAIAYPSGQTWWYRRRGDVRHWIKQWLTGDTDRTRVLIVPLLEDIDWLLQSIGPVPDLVVVKSGMSKGAYAETYNAVQRGQARRVIGTGLAVTLPYAQAPEWLIDQEEHPAHKQTQQHPRTDHRRLLVDVKADLWVTTPAPSVWWLSQGTLDIPAGQGERRLATLAQPKSAPWITGELETALDDVRDQGHSLGLIVPQRGYAQAIWCGDCRKPVACAHCGRTVGLAKKSNDEVVCRFCTHHTPIPDRCPTCGGSTWSLHGVGIEKMIETITTRWPQIACDPVTLTRSGVMIDTYAGYRRFSTLPLLDSIFIVSGEAMLQAPDFSVHERAWQYLARIQAEYPEVPVTVQTFDVENDFWQRWLHHDDAAWYAAERKSRQEMRLPPVVDQWIVRCPAKVSDRDLAALMGQLQTIPKLKVEHLADRQKTAAHTSYTRLLLSAVTGTTVADLVDARKLFPYPWQVETGVQSWLD